MQITLMLCLPRDESTLPVVRHIAGFSLRELGVEEEAISDVELALTEASANVVKHSGVDDKYEVHLALQDKVCEIRVIDTGHGFDATAPFDGAAATDESGRGIQLMRALVDRVKLESKPEEGTVVHLEKRLEFSEASILKRLS